MRYLAIGLMLLWSHSAFAQVASPSERSMKELRDAPQQFLADVAALILGYGTANGIDGDGIVFYVAVQRSKARAREMHRLLTADLDGDGVVTEGEVDLTIRPEAARSKARLVLGHRAADTDADGQVTLDEMRVHAAQAGVKALSDAEAARLENLLVLDADGDKRLSLDEAMGAVKQLMKKGV